MNGPEHYHKAEEMMRDAGLSNTLQDRARRVSEAQVHALLAVAAATVDAQAGEQGSLANRRSWRDAFAEEVAR